MKIALVTTSFLPRIGGAEFVVHHLARQWALDGHDVCVFNTETSDATAAKGAYTVQQYRELRGGYRFGQHRFPFRWYGARQVGRLLREFRPDFVSAHFGYPVALWLSRVRPLPEYLITCHGPALNETVTGPRQIFAIDDILAEALNRSVGAVALTTHARQVMERLGVQPSRIVDIPNGVDLDRFRGKTSFALRSRFGLAEDALVVLSVGREVWAKAYDTGIRAFAEAAKGRSDVYYIIAGRGVTKWETLARELAGRHNVVLCEGLYGEELAGAYQQADIFFSPSVKEMFPLVVLEAMASGLPAVVTNVSGSQDVIRTGENGIVVEPDDPKEMARALRELIENAETRRRFGRVNLTRSESFSWERIARSYLECSRTQRSRPPVLRQGPI